MLKLLDGIHCRVTINVEHKTRNIAFFDKIIYNIKKFVERRGKRKMNQSDFWNYMSNFIDIEEIEAICILLFSLVVGFVIFQAFSFYGRQYEKNLESAIQKKEERPGANEKRKSNFVRF